MPYRRFDWHQHITEVWGEYRSARAAVDRLKAAVAATPDLLKKDPVAREYLSDADKNLGRDLHRPPLRRVRGGAPLVRPGEAQRPGPQRPTRRS